MFTPTFQDWPRPNRLLLYALLTTFVLALLVLYLYVMPKWRQYQNYQQTIAEKEAQLAATPWPQEMKLLKLQYENVRERLDGIPGTDQIGLATLTEGILRQATSTFEERILAQFDSPQHFITSVSRIDYQGAYDRFAQELAEQELTLDAAYFGLNEDGQEPVWQMILKLWTAQQICQMAQKNHLSIVGEDGIAALTALPPISYALDEAESMPPYLLEFPARVKLMGRLDDFLCFAQSLSDSVCFLPIRQLEVHTLPPQPPIPGQVNRVDTAVFTIVCSSFLQPRSFESASVRND